MRPLHASYLKTGSPTEVRPLHASLIIPLCVLLGWSILIRSCLWVSICAPKGSVFLWFAQFWRGRTSETTAHTLLKMWVTGWSETTTSTPYHITLFFVGGDLLSLDYICGYQSELLKGQCVYDLYSFAWTEQVRPLHASYLKTGSLTEVRPLQAPFHITLCPVLGCCFHIKSYLWVPKRTVQMYLCPWFVLFCLGRTNETTARILLENWVIGLGETTASIPYYITVYCIGLMFSHQIIPLCVSRVSFKCQCVYGLYSFAWTEQMRPLHASYLKTGSLAEVRPLQASLVISLCALLGWSIPIRSCLWASICAPKGSVCLWFVQFWRGRTSETTAHTLLEIWVTGWSETTTSTPYHITLCFVGVIFSH